MPIHHERRLNQLLWEYWDQLRELEPFPPEEALDQAKLEPLWDGCFLIQTRDIEAVTDFNYSYFGPKLLAAYDEGVVPATIPGVVAPAASHLRAQLGRIIRTGEPILTEDSHPLQGGQMLRYRQILLPLGSRRQRVEAVLGRAGFAFYDE